MHGFDKGKPKNRRKFLWLFLAGFGSLFLNKGNGYEIVIYRRYGNLFSKIGDDEFKLMQDGANGSLDDMLYKINHEVNPHLKIKGNRLEDLRYVFATAAQNSTLISRLQEGKEIRMPYKYMPTPKLIEGKRYYFPAYVNK